ncbi:hypothetical protein [Zooshikella harenae]|uniref:Uncharacterized protein n=1 Tax=Zooshikella harenae TaxID=2827238 RepID=A0ABS5ZGV3_9GAMM|nr:hypothetical protein [Zooshikella harenae]MBU2713195.1 hypothetical protein [Zooshikella harenae]
MPKKKRVGVLVVSVAIVIGAFLGLTITQSPDCPSSINSEAPSSIKKNESTPSTLTTSESEKSPLVSTRASSAVPVLNQPAEIESVKKEFDYLSDQQLHDGRTFIHFEMQALNEFEVGHTFHISFIQDGQTYTGKVNSITEFEGIKRITGSFEGLPKGQINRFSMTISEDGNYVSANFSPGAESFTLEAKNGLGWINNLKNEEDFLHDSEKEMSPTE